MSLQWFAAAAALVTIGCTAAQWAALSAGFRTVSITIEGATIGPTKADGSSWDCCATISKEQRNAAIQLLSLTNPQAMVASVFGEIILAEASKPDPYAIVEVIANGQTVARVQLPKHHDTYLPSWQFTIPNVRWAQEPRLRITFMDSDADANDNIGVVYVTTAELETALAAGKTHFAAVGDQAQNQVLFVSISVTAEGWRYGQGTSTAAL